MENQIVKAENTTVALTEDYKAVATEFLKSMGMNLPEKYARQFIDIAKAYGLNPFKREIYAVGYGDNYNIITGYEVYLKRAERTGKLNGWSVKVSGQIPNMIATITINRKDWGMPFTHEVYYNEAVGKKKDGQINSMWTKMPAFMLKKVAIAQGFRLCFPDELGGMPYTNDEIEVNEAPIRNITPTTEQATQSQNQNTVAAAKLIALKNKYESYLPEDAKKMINDVINSGDEKAINGMIQRTEFYLTSKHINIA